MPIKFFPKDVIGPQPTKVGDKFEATFFGETCTFVVSEFHGTFFFAEL